MAPMPSSDAEIEGVARRRIGTVLHDKYRIDRVLGVGGMAAVYAATHRNTKQFAIKVLHAELSLRPNLRARFVREGYVANTVRHPGAVAVLDDDVAEDGSAFLVMELLEGATLKTVWKSRGERISVRDALVLGSRLLDVLDAAHRRGVIHRDIKPANLFLTSSGELKVLDFGIARLADGSDSASTITGVMLGTPTFMAPEQALGQSSDIDARTDVWAVGATLFTLITGQLVHDADNVQKILVLAATTGARSAALADPSLPEPVVELIDRALAFRRDDRFPSAHAMRDAIAKAYRDVVGEPIEDAELAGLVSGATEHDVTISETLPAHGPGFTPAQSSAPGGTISRALTHSARPRPVRRRVLVPALAVAVCAAAIGFALVTRRAPPAVRVAASIATPPVDEVRPPVPVAAPSTVPAAPSASASVSSSTPEIPSARALPRRTVRSTPPPTAIATSAAPAQAPAPPVASSAPAPWIDPGSVR